MISAIVLASESRSGDDLEHAHEVIVRSLVWLVSAVVAGVVRDVILAVPAGFGLSEVADQSGCVLIEVEDEASRLASAVKAARGPWLLLLKAGFQLDSRVTEEIDSFVRRGSVDAAAFILAAPDTPLQRIFPGRAPIVGALVSGTTCAAKLPTSFGGLVRSMRGGVHLRTRATRIV